MARKKKQIYSQESSTEEQEAPVEVEEVAEQEEQEEVAEVAPEEPVVVEAAVEPVAVEQEETETDKEAILRRLKTNAANFSKEYFEKRKKSGCDYTQCGLWQEMYARFLNRAFALGKKVVLDVGGAYGAIAHAIKVVGAARVICADISKYVVEAKTFNDVEYLYAPVQHMKAIDSETVDFVHASHVMEYIDPIDIERSIKEIGRVLKSGGSCFITSEVDIPNIVAACEKYIGDVPNVNLVAADKEHGFLKQYPWKVFVFRKK